LKLIYANEDLPIQIMDCVKRYNVSPSRINLEITETSDAYSRKMMEDNIKVLKELGFSFSLDDYGNGYSSMDNVSSMPVDTIKLERTLTNNDNPDMKVMFEHSIKMIKDLKKKIVIEGVENEDILKHFESDLCDYIQGFYFSKPLPKEDLIKFLFVKKGIIKEGEELPKENE
jgi:EAL domain-containing protein (putative c-di-GMP-specific phosphodiesterase class I)